MIKMKFVSVNVLAKHLQLTPRRVQHLAKDKIIPKASRGKYDLVRCLTAYVKFLADWRSSAAIPCSAEDLARFLGLKKKQILYLTQHGAIPQIAPGRYDLAVGIQAYLSFVRKNYEEGKIARPGKKAPWQCPEVKGLPLAF